MYILMYVLKSTHGTHGLLARGHRWRIRTNEPFWLLSCPPYLSSLLFSLKCFQLLVSSVPSIRIKTYGEKTAEQVTVCKPVTVATTSCPHLLQLCVMHHSCGQAWTIPYLWTCQFSFFQHSNVLAQHCLTIHIQSSFSNLGSGRRH